MSKWGDLALRVINGNELSKEDALSILNSSDFELLEVLQGAYKIRHHYYGNKVKLNMIINTKSGMCPENCGYCAQSSISTAPIQKYRMMDKDQILKGAEQAYQLNVGTYCIVASGRGPSHHEVDQVVSAVKEIKDKYQLKVCACLGILKPEQAVKLKEAGVDRYNHNLNTSENHHESITTSHSYQDRVNTVQLVKESGISPCSGCDHWDEGNDGRCCRYGI